MNLNSRYAQCRLSSRRFSFLLLCRQVISRQELIRSTNDRPSRNSNLLKEKKIKVATKASCFPSLQDFPYVELNVYESLDLVIYLTAAWRNNYKTKYQNFLCTGLKTKVKHDFRPPQATRQILQPFQPLFQPANIKCLRINTRSIRAFNLAQQAGPPQKTYGTVRYRTVR